MWVLSPRCEKITLSTGCSSACGVLPACSAWCRALGPHFTHKSCALHPPSELLVLAFGVIRDISWLGLDISHCAARNGGELGLDYPTAPTMLSEKHLKQMQELYLG